MSHFGRVLKILLERGDNPEKGEGVDVEMGGGGGLPIFYYFTVQSHFLCVWGKSLLYCILILQSFELTMQGSHPSLYL